MMKRINRREFVMAGAATGLAAAAPRSVFGSAPAVQTGERVRPLVIASANGHGPRNSGSMTCVERAFGMLAEGEDVLDVVVEGVTIVELNPEAGGVGYGGAPTADGVVQLDACCMHGPKKQAGGVVALLVLCSLPVAMTACGPSGQGEREDDGVESAIVLETQGSFAFGGTVITGDNGDTFHGDHGYVQFQIPQDARQYPLVMWHGGGQFSKTYETTPDGRDGYQNIFLRKGFPIYIVDQPGRGRAGRSTAGTTIPEGVPGEANLFTIFRLGIWTPPDPPMFFPGVQFADDPDTINQYFRQVTPDTGSAGGGVTGVGRGATLATDAVAALFDAIGPAVLITHSASGVLGWQTALKSENVKAIISYEPTVFVAPAGEPSPPPGFAPAVPVPSTEFKKLTEIPIQIVFGDNIATELSGIFGIDLWVRSVPAAESFVKTVNAHGGDAELLQLPDVGVLGNTHFPFSDLNNVEVADLLADYLAEKGLDAR